MSKIGDSVVTVIVPVYNVENYLRNCVESVLAQSYSKFDLILIDDGSPDNCGRICDEYAEKDFRVHVIHQENGGLSAARNAGIEWSLASSNSRWITFVDSDDVVSSCFLERMIRALTDNDAEIAVCRYLQFYSDSPSDDRMSSDTIQVYSGRDACFRLYDDDGVIFTIACAKLYCKELFKGIRFPVGRYHEDEATTYRVLYSANKVVELDSKLYYYRVNPDGIMNSRFSLKRFDGLIAYKERERFFVEHDDAELAKKTAKMGEIVNAALIIRAKQAGIHKQVPNGMRLPVWKALSILRNKCSDNKYTYYLAMVHPGWLLPHAYIRKLKSCISIKKK